MEQNKNLQKRKDHCKLMSLPVGIGPTIANLINVQIDLNYGETKSIN